MFSGFYVEHTSVPAMGSGHRPDSSISRAETAIRLLQIASKAFQRPGRFQGAERSNAVAIKVFAVRRRSERESGNAGVPSVRHRRPTADSDSCVCTGCLEMYGITRIVLWSRT